MRCNCCNKTITEPTAKICGGRCVPCHRRRPSQRLLRLFKGSWAVFAFLFSQLFQRRHGPIESPPSSPKPKHCPTCRSVLIFRRVGGCDPDGSRWDGAELICPQCGPVELEDPVVPDNAAEPIPVSTDSDGWARCPCCGFRFCATTDEFFRFGRHRRCGQRLLVAPCTRGK